MRLAGYGVYFDNMNPDIVEHPGEQVLHSEILYLAPHAVERGLNLVGHPSVGGGRVKAVDDARGAVIEQGPREVMLLRRDRLMMIVVSELVGQCR
ncbi:hypothetical protein BG57_05860 [Caballeronia grimmiae]|uniref:Uncharacterized protein n=1 Tax=Caballeronia grimmiae TaxID=1071679 RepID=A0A069P3R1_9BURK|nr:hypothetical protein BG57_05860 [Caballeronia grimmiae]